MPRDPRPTYRQQGALFVGLTTSQIRHVVAIQRVLRVIADHHPQLLNDALAALNL